MRQKPPPLVKGNTDDGVLILLLLNPSARIALATVERTITEQGGAR